MKATIEHTDLFGGELNYCWVNRASIECDGLTPLKIVRRLKKAIGIDGLKARRTYDSGDYIQYKLDGLHQAFVIYIEY